MSAAEATESLGTLGYSGVVSGRQHADCCSTCSLLTDAYLDAFDEMVFNDPS